MDKIALHLTVQEINVIISALAKQPYEAVAEVINKVRAESLAQLNSAQPTQDEEAE